VEAFQPKHKVLKPKYSDIFQLSMFDTNPSPIMTLSDEKEEEAYTVLVLKKSLVLAGLLGTITSRGGLGQPDGITTEEDVEIAAPADIRLVIEFKSTHNLPIPMTDADVVVAYNTPVCVRVLDRLDQVYWLAARTRSSTRGRYFGTDQRTVHFGE
jgi:hypothetical protein